MTEEQADGHDRLRRGGGRAGRGRDAEPKAPRRRASASAPAADGTERAKLLGGEIATPASEAKPTLERLFAPIEEPAEAEQPAEERPRLRRLSETASRKRCRSRRLKKRRCRRRTRVALTPEPAPVDRRRRRESPSLDWRTAASPGAKPQPGS